MICDYFVLRSAFCWSMTSICAAGFTSIRKVQLAGIAALALGAVLRWLDWSIPPCASV